MPDIKNHDLDCDECREFQKETKMERAYRKALNVDLRNILDEKLQITIQTIQRVDRIEKIITWLIIAHVAELFGLIVLILKIYQR
jgi:hypothetical protein